MDSSRCVGSTIKFSGFGDYHHVIIQNLILVLASMVQPNATCTFKYYFEATVSKMLMDFDDT